MEDWWVAHGLLCLFKKKRFYTYQKEKGRMFKFTKQSLVSLDQELTSSLTPRRLRIMRAGQC